MKSRTLALGTYTKAPKCVSRVSRAWCLKTRVNPAGSPYFSTMLDMFYTLLDILIVMEIHCVKCKLGNAWRALNNRLIRFFSVLSLHETSTCFCETRLTSRADATSRETKKNKKMTLRTYANFSVYIRTYVACEFSSESKLQIEYQKI